MPYDLYDWLVCLVCLLVVGSVCALLGYLAGIEACRLPPDQEESRALKTLEAIAERRISKCKE